MVISTAIMDCLFWLRRMHSLVLRMAKLLLRRLLERYLLLLGLVDSIRIIMINRWDD